MIIKITKSAYRYMLAMVMIIALGICTPNSDTSGLTGPETVGSFSEAAFTLSFPVSFDDSTEAESSYVITESLRSTGGMSLRNLFRSLALAIMLSVLAWSFILHTRIFSFFFRTVCPSHVFTIRYIHNTDAYKY